MRRLTALAALTVGSCGPAGPPSAPTTPFVVEEATIAEIHAAFASRLTALPTLVE